MMDIIFQLFATKQHDITITMRILNLSSKYRATSTSSLASLVPTLTDHCLFII